MSPPNKTAASLLAICLFIELAGRSRYGPNVRNKVVTSILRFAAGHDVETCALTCLTNGVVVGDLNVDKNQVAAYGKKVRLDGRLFMCAATGGCPTFPRLRRCTTFPCFRRGTTFPCFRRGTTPPPALSMAQLSPSSTWEIPYITKRSILNVRWLHCGQRAPRSLEGSESNDSRWEIPYIKERWILNAGKLHYGPRPPRSFETSEINDFGNRISHFLTATRLSNQGE